MKMGSLEERSGSEQRGKDVQMEVTESPGSVKGHPSLKLSLSTQGCHLAGPETPQKSRATPADGLL